VGSPAKASKRGPISAASLISMTLGRTAKIAAAASNSWRWNTVEGLAGLRTSATRVTSGAICFRI
jgi:hypothetical protein